MKLWMALLVFAATLLGQSPNVPLRDETAGFGKIYQTLISAFDHTDIVALGEHHWRKVDSDIRIGLVRNPDFPKKVHSIVVEFGSTSEQQTLDRYIRGENVSREEFEQVWKTTTQTTGVWNSPVYANFLAAVRDVNMKLPAESKIRVFGGDPGTGDYRTRDAAAISVLKEQVLDKHGKALLIYGTGHLFRTNGAIDFLSSIGGGITKTLDVDYPGRTFVVITLGGPDPKYQKFERALTTSLRPVLVSLQRSPFRELLAEEFISSDIRHFAKGHWVGVYDGSGVTLGQLADACIYLGTSGDVDTSVEPNR